jgi:AraC-like DNA-binding protein
MRSDTAKGWLHRSSGQYERASERDGLRSQQRFMELAREQEPIRGLTSKPLTLPPPPLQQLRRRAKLGARSAAATKCCSMRPDPAMFLVIEDRLSDLRCVDRVWSAHNDRAGEVLSIAATACELVVSRYRDQTFLTVRGPETRMTRLDCPPEGEWLGIRFKAGTFLPQFPPTALSDRKDVTLPDATTRSFWLNGSAWEYPTFENADTFVARLLKKGIVVRDRTVEATVRGELNAVSLRSAQRHFLRATGITHAKFRAIQRARYATNLLREGASIADVVHLAGYFDQPHLTRSLRYLIGQTPVEIAHMTRQLSYLYKTTPPPRLTLRPEADDEKDNRGG